MVKFQILDWSSYHEEIDGEDDTTKKIFTIRLFGRTEKPDNKTIHVQVNGFTPYFYVKIPDTWKSVHVELFMREVKNRVQYQFRESIQSYDVQKKHNFYGFTNKALFTFLRLV